MLCGNSVLHRGDVVMKAEMVLGFYGYERDGGRPDKRRAATNVHLSDD